MKIAPITFLGLHIGKLFIVNVTVWKYGKVVSFWFKYNYLLHRSNKWLLKKHSKDPYNAMVSEYISIQAQDEGEIFYTG